VLREGQTGIKIALAAMCVYPVLDVPRINGCSSWWRGAIISILIWVGVLAAIAAALDSVQPMREGSLVFLLPFMMYAAALALSALVRLEGLISGRPRESGPRIAAVVVTAACAIFVGRPMLRTSPLAVESRTGNTPENMSHVADGEVLSATAEQMSVRFGSVVTETVRIGPDTKFSFLGPAWQMQTIPAGPDWLKPGQRIGVQYIYRNHERWAQHVTIRVETAP
jgi:hypothetical protein